MAKNNKGFSLVELIVTMAIMAILIGGIGLSFRFLTQNDVKESSYAIDSAITLSKSKNMAKVNQQYLFLYRYQDGYYVKQSETATVTLDANGEKVGSSSVAVLLDGVVMSNGTVTRIAFARKDGRITEGPKVISVQSDKTYEIHLIHNTGKHFVKTQ